MCGVICMIYIVCGGQLFYRSVSIVADLSKVCTEDAEKALLKAIYEEDQISEVT